MQNSTLQGMLLTATSKSNFFEFMNRSTSRLVTCLGLQHPQRLDFLNSNTCFYSRLYGNSNKVYLNNQLQRNRCHICNVHQLSSFHDHCMQWQHHIRLLVKEKRKMASMSNLTVYAKVKFNLEKNQLTGAVASKISILAQTFSIIPTGAMITAVGTLVAQN